MASKRLLPAIIFAWSVTTSAIAGCGSCVFCGVNPLTYAFGCFEISEYGEMWGWTCCSNVGGACRYSGQACGLADPAPAPIERSLNLIPGSIGNIQAVSMIDANQLLRPTARARDRALVAAKSDVANNKFAFDQGLIAEIEAADHGLAAALIRIQMEVERTDDMTGGMMVGAVPSNLKDLANGANIPPVNVEQFEWLFTAGSSNTYELAITARTATARSIGNLITFDATGPARKLRVSFTLANASQQAITVQGWRIE